MTTHTRIRFAASFLLIALGLATEVSAQAAPPDPWKLVPAAPTTCHPEDGFSDKAAAAITAIEAAIARQKEVNDKARERFDNMDMPEKAQRMQAFMMKNPQAAMKMMQAEQAAGAAVTSSLPEIGEHAKRLDAELSRQQASFRAATEQAVKAALAKQTQLIDAKTVAVGEAAIPMFTVASDHAQYVQLIGQENASYETACAPYFGAGGTFHKWLSNHRAEIIEKTIALSDGTDAGIAMQMAALDLPGGGHRSTAALEGARDYTRKMIDVYSIRRKLARPNVDLRK